MRHPPKAFAALALAAALAGASGCGGGGGGSHLALGLPPAGGGGTVVYALPSVATTLDPLAATGRAAMTVTRQVYEPLIEHLKRPYGEAAPQAGLALTAHPSRDRTTWTITLRSGIRFQDGTAFNAAAVLVNARRWSSDPAGRALLPHLFAVDAPRPNEVRFLLDQPVPDLVRRLASARLGIVSPRALAPQGGHRLRFEPDARGSGTGPFRGGSGGAGRLDLARFAGWWGTPMGLGPSLDGVSFVSVPQPGRRLRLLRDGGVQIADPLGPSDLRAADADPLLTTVGGAAGGIGMEGSVRGIGSARAVPVLSGVWLTRLTG